MCSRRETACSVITVVRMPLTRIVPCGFSRTVGRRLTANSYRLACVPMRRMRRRLCAWASHDVSRQVQQTLSPSCGPARRQPSAFVKDRWAKGGKRRHWPSWSGTRRCRRSTVYSTLLCWICSERAESIALVQRHGNHCHERPIVARPSQRGNSDDRFLWLRRLAANDKLRRDTHVSNRGAGEHELREDVRTRGTPASSRGRRRSNGGRAATKPGVNESPKRTDEAYRKGRRLRGNQHLCAVDRCKVSG
jgi:hypothetical protein